VYCIGTALLVQWSVSSLGCHVGTALPQKVSSCPHPVIVP